MTPLASKQAQLLPDLHPLDEHVLKVMGNRGAGGAQLAIGRRGKIFVARAYAFGLPKLVYTGPGNLGAVHFVALLLNTLSPNSIGTSELREIAKLVEDIEHQGWFI